jgi:hypothetical protein
MNLVKATVARRQLGTALALFIDDLDPVSVHTLACAGAEIAEHLTRKAGWQPFIDHALATFPERKLSDIRTVQNQFWNAFKHALTRDQRERQDQQLFERFDDSQNDHTLFIGWYDYALAVGSMPVEAQVFQMWYFALYPEKLNPEVDTSEYEAIFPGLQHRPRAEQKKMLRETIASARNDSTIMSDPRTDTLPLIASS